PSPVSTVVPILWQAGGEMYAEDGKSVLFNQQPGIDALEFMVTIFKEGYAQKGNVTGGGLPFSSGKIGVMVQAENQDVKNALKENGALKIDIFPTLTKAKTVNFGTVG